ncbi:MAG: sugar transferase, partial [Verrucomicrobia bacterium]|nr:sugar transferase [Verrucomicrobiota bacterium]
MKKRDSSDVMLSTVAVICDAAAIFGGLMFATWIRFGSGWLPEWLLRNPAPPRPYQLYAAGSGVVALMFLFVYRSRGLFIRPQTGSFIDKIPRIAKSTALGTFITAVLAFAMQNEADFARLVIGMSFFSVLFFVMLERYILFRIEWHLARHSNHKSNILLLGTDHVAVHVRRTLKKEAMLRAHVTGFLSTSQEPPDAEIRPEQILGSVDELATLIGAKEIDEIVLTDSRLDHDRIVQILLLCEHNLITFKMVPDLFRIMTTSMDVQSLNDIPLLGISTWPLDKFWNCLTKRIEDIVGALVGLFVSAPIIAVAAILVKRSSPGPIFYRQERCGEEGRSFTLYKLRTMPVDAEAESGPVWTVENDARRTAIGGVLRRYNLDELPQFWNVLRGDMSLVGPRPERPHFVEKFKEDIGRYMWRHVSKPGLTGWAQVNGRNAIEWEKKFE